MTASPSWLKLHRFGVCLDMKCCLLSGDLTSILGSDDLFILVCQINFPCELKITLLKSLHGKIEYKIVHQHVEEPGEKTLLLVMIFLQVGTPAACGAATCASCTSPKHTFRINISIQCLFGITCGWLPPDVKMPCTLGRHERKQEKTAKKILRGAWLSQRATHSISEHLVPHPRPHRSPASASFACFRVIRLQRCLRCKSDRV